MNYPTTSTKQVAFMRAYEPVHERLCRFVQTLVWDKAEAKDVVSETTLIAYQQFEKVKQPESFLYFLFAIAANMVKKRSRRKKFWGVFDSEETHSAIVMPAGEDNLLRRQLYEALNKLPPKQREAIVLFDINGFSIKEIAQIQGLSESGVKSNLRRGKEKLTKLLVEPKAQQKQVAVGHVHLTSERSTYGK